jgi:hypothetical protein
MNQYKWYDYVDKRNRISKLERILGVSGGSAICRGNMDGKKSNNLGWV